AFAAIAHSRFWHFSGVHCCSLHGRFRGQSRQLLKASPERGLGGDPLRPMPACRPARTVGHAVRTARSWRGILSLTHLAREGRMTVTIGRRELLVAVGGAAAWPLAARAQQPKMPLIGFLSGVSPDANVDRVRAFRQGLKETGYLEGENVAIEYRWAEGRYG